MGAQAFKWGTPHRYFGLKWNTLFTRTLRSQVEIFDACVRIPDLSISEELINDIPSRAHFPSKILQVRKHNHEPYSKTTYAFFTLKLLQNMRKRWKVSHAFYEEIAYPTKWLSVFHFQVECILGQPLFVEGKIEVIRYMLSATSTCSDDYQKYKELFGVFPQW